MHEHSSDLERHRSSLESDETVIVEDNHDAFQLDSVRVGPMLHDRTSTPLPCEGHSVLYSIEVDGQQNLDAAGLPGAASRRQAEIAGRVTFWRWRDGRSQLSATELLEWRPPVPQLTAAAGLAVPELLDRG